MFQRKQKCFLVYLVIILAVIVFKFLIKTKPHEDVDFAERITKKGAQVYWRCNNTNSHSRKNDNVISKEKLDIVVRRHPNLPPFLVYNETLHSGLPGITSIRWNAIVYQESWREHPKFLLYSAHFDARTRLGLIVRLITLYDGELELKFPYDFYCQFTYHGFHSPITSTVYRADIIQSKPFSKDYLNAYGISCQVPKSFEHYPDVPAAVSLVRHQCETPTNVLKISGSPRKKKKKSLTDGELKFGVCGKALFYYNVDFSPRLIEWVEMMKILGASKIFLYQTTCHENVQKVLDFYEKEGTVKLISFYYPPPYVQEPTFLRAWTKIKPDAYRAAQRMYLDDCILRNKDEFDFLAVHDSDEVPIFKEHKNLTQFLRYFQKLQDKSDVGGLFIKWKLFYQDLSPGPSARDVPQNFYILRHNRRTKLATKEAPLFERNGKSIYDTDKVLWVNCHEAQNFIEKSTHYEKVDRELAYMAHFGDHNCRPEIYCTEESIEEDNSLLLYKEQVIERTMNVIRQLGLDG